MHALQDQAPGAISEYPLSLHNWGMSTCSKLAVANGIRVVNNLGGGRVCGSGGQVPIVITSSADSGRAGHIGLRRKVPWTLRDRPGAWGSGDWSVRPPWGLCTKSRRPRVYKFCSLWPPSCSCPLEMSLDTLSKATLSTAPSPCHMARLWGSPSLARSHFSSAR